MATVKIVLHGGDSVYVDVPDTDAHRYIAEVLAEDSYSQVQTAPGVFAYIPGRSILWVERDTTGAGTPAQFAGPQAL